MLAQSSSFRVVKPVRLPWRLLPRHRELTSFGITYTAIKELGVPNFYGLYDAKGAESAEAAVAVGFGWKGETVEELAEVTGMDAVKLADAIERDPDLTEAPYYAVMVKPTTIGSMGGLVIDTDAQVLREDGSAIIDEDGIQDDATIRY